MPVEVLGWFATAAVVARLLPQPLRLRRTGVPAGVSVLSVLNNAVSDVGWLLYGLTAGLPPVWMVAVATLTPGVWTAWLLRARTTRRDLGMAGLWSAVVLAAWWSGGLAVVLGLSVLVNYFPQVRTALREHDLSGIAPLTWLLALVDAALWGAYGLLLGDVALLGYAVALAAAAVVILSRVALTPAPRPAT